MTTEKSDKLSLATTEIAAGANEPLSAPIRLWLVDDNDQLRQMLAEMLTTTRAVECTHSFRSANAALSALASKAGPDVILLDINMGAENGLDAVRPILSLSRSTRVLMLTTFFDSKAKSRALDDGASGFLLKRCSAEQILESIRQARLNPVPPASRHRRSCANVPALSPSDQTRGNNDLKSNDLKSKSWLARIWSMWSWN